MLPSFASVCPQTAAITNLAIPPASLFINILYEHIMLLSLASVSPGMYLWLAVIGLSESWHVPVTCCHWPQWVLACTCDLLPLASVNPSMYLWLEFFYEIVELCDLLLQQQNPVPVHWPVTLVTSITDPDLQPWKPITLQTQMAEIVVTCWQYKICQFPLPHF